MAQDIGWAFAEEPEIVHLAACKHAIECVEVDMLVGWKMLHY